ncbi:MAG: RNA polymerase sigma factor [Myxococcales bacterium]|nr:RNA polymerase sigma factor [Myxococcales bacterium]
MNATAAMFENLESQGIADLYRAYGPELRRRAYAVLRDPVAAEDAVQDVFIKAMRHGDALRDAASPRTWLYRVATNHCLNLKRDSMRRRRLLDAKVAPAMDQVAGPSLDARLTAERLLDRAPAEVADVARCFYYGEMTQDETAAELAVSRRTVGYRLQAFRQLAEQL